MAFVFSISAQELGLSFKKLNFGSDPSRNSITKIHQDKFGFLWFGTKFGLARFDGYKEKVFTFNHADSNSIKGNFIRDFDEDETGNLWIATDDGGVSYYNQQYNIFSAIYLDSLFDKDWNKRIWSIHVDLEKNNIIWIATDFGLVRYDNFSKSAKLINKFQNNIESELIVTIFEDSKNRLWLGTAKNGVLIFDKKQSFKNYKIKKNNSTFDDFIWKIYEDKNSTIWIGTQGNGFAKFDDVNNRLVNYTKEISHNSLSDNRVLDLIQPKSFPEKIFLATWNGGLNIFDVQTKKFHFYNSDNGLVSNDVLSIFEDNSGIIWIGTESNGVNYILPQSSKFGAFIIPSKTLPISVRNFLEINNDIIISTSSGLFVKKSGKNTLEKFNERFNINFDIKNVLSLALYKNILFVGSFYDGLFFINIDSKKIEQLKLPGSENDNPISFLLFDRKSNLWVGTFRSGIYKFSKNMKFLKNYKTENGFLKSNFITSILEDTKGNIWIGTRRGGLHFLDPSTEKINHYGTVINDAKSLSSNDIVKIFQDSDERIWIGTEGSGINKFIFADQSFIKYGESEGLIGDNIREIVEDNQKNFWISTSNGISKFILDRNNIINFNVDEGLHSNQFSINSSIIINDTIYFGGVAGFTFFDPSVITNNLEKPDVYLTSLKIFNKEAQFGKNITFCNKIELEYNQNVISFEFSALNYIYPEKNQYMYMLEGFHDEWIFSGTNRFATFTNLDPGNYTLKYKASNNDGVWNEEVKSLSIYITPPYWLSWWFRLFLALFILSIFYGFYRYRINKILALERLRIRIASDLHDDIGSSLTKISVNAGMLNYEIDKSKMKSRLSKIEETSREIISSMSDIIWSIDARRDKLSELFNRIRNISFDILSDQNIAVKLEIPNLSNDYKISVENRENIYLIVKEAINNAAKHSKAKSLLIKIIVEKSKMEIFIEDDGCGINEKDFSKGNGLSNMKMRAESIGAKIYFKNENGFLIHLKTEKILTHINRGFTFK